MEYIDKKNRVNSELSFRPIKLTVIFSLRDRNSSLFRLQVPVEFTLENREKKTNLIRGLRHCIFCTKGSYRSINDFTFLFFRISVEFVSVQSATVFTGLSHVLERILMEHIEMKNSLVSWLFFILICFIQNLPLEKDNPVFLEHPSACPH